MAKDPTSLVRYGDLLDAVDKVVTRRLRGVTGGSGSGGSPTIQDDGVFVGARPTINFTGGFNVTDDAGNTRVIVDVSGVSNVARGMHTQVEAAGSYLKFGLAPDNDFAQNAVQTPWPQTRAVTAAHQILAGFAYQPIATSAYVARLAPFNKGGFYHYQKSMHECANENPALGTVWTDPTTLISCVRDGQPVPFLESWFVHFGGFTDNTHRLRLNATHTIPRWLMKFDDPDVFDQVFVFNIDNMLAAFEQVLPGATPGIFIDAFPNHRGSWVDQNGNPTSNWDHFNTSTEYYEGCVTLLRRIKTRYPHVHLACNWSVDVEQGISDKVLELVDWVLFEGFYDVGVPLIAQQHLSVGYKLQKMGKGAMWNGSVLQASQPTIDQMEGGTDYLVQFLLTQGPRSTWLNRWRPSGDQARDAVNYINDISRRYGTPCDDMKEIDVNLWRRRYTACEVYYNSDTFDTRTIKPQWCEDSGGNPLETITLGPGKGAVAFKQNSAAFGADAPYSAYWKELPNEAGGAEYCPVAKRYDGLQASIGIGLNQIGGNLIKNTDVTVWNKSGATTITVDGNFIGIPMYKVDNPFVLPVISYAIQATGNVQNKWLHVYFYAQQTDVDIGVLIVAIDNATFQLMTPVLRAGWPKMYHGSVQLTNAFFASGGLKEFNIDIRPINSSVLGSWKMGGVRAIITDTNSDYDASSEFIETSGTGLRRTRGTGIGVPLTVASLAAYTHEDGTAASIAVTSPVVSTAAVTVTALTATGLTSGRVVYVGSGGLLSSDAGLTYNDSTDTLSAGSFASSTLTSGRVAIVGASGLITDDGGLTYNASTDALTVTGSVTISGLTAGRVPVVGTAGLLTDDAGFTFNTSTDALTIGGVFTAGSDADGTHVLGRAKIGSAAGSDSAQFAHFDLASTDEFAVMQNSTGFTRVSCKSGQNVFLQYAGTTRINLDSTGIGFFGGTPVAKQTLGGNLTNNITSGGTTRQLDDFSTSVGVDVVNAASQTDVNARLASIRNALYQIGDYLRLTGTGVRNFNLFT